MTAPRYHSALPCEDPDHGSVVLVGSEPLLRTAIDSTDPRRHEAAAREIARALDAFPDLLRAAEAIYPHLVGRAPALAAQLNAAIILARGGAAARSRPTPNPSGEGWARNGRRNSPSPFPLPDGARVAHRRKL